MFHSEHKAAGATLMDTIAYPTGTPKQPRPATTWFSKRQRYPFSLDPWWEECCRLDGEISGTQSNKTLKCPQSPPAAQCAYAWGTLFNSNFIWDGPRTPPQSLFNLSAGPGDVLTKNHAHVKKGETAFEGKNSAQRLVLPSTWTTSSCLLVTVFRRPITRLASALFYCKENHNKDPLCGSEPRQFFEGGSMKKMAEYWGNFLFLDLLSHPAIISRVQKGEQIDTSLRGGNISKGGTTWELWRRWLRGGDDPRAGKAGLLNFKLVYNNLLPSYVHIPFVVEKWVRSSEVCASCSS